MFKTILAASDLLEASEGAVMGAIELCRRNQAGLLAIHVLESSYSGIFRHFVKDSNTGEERVVSKDYEEATKRRLRTKWALAMEPCPRYETEIAVGIPWIEIVRAARRHRADLVVMGAHGKGAEEKGVARQTGTVGSTVQGVVMGASCPVMVVNRKTEGEKLGFRKVMVCVDFSRSCDYAIGFAGGLAMACGSRLLLFHILRVTPLSELFPTKLEDEASKVQKRLLAYQRGFAAGTESHWHVGEGSLPYTAILNYASEKNVDLIVMGSHTRTSREKWHVGSTVHEVSTKAVCPVVVVTHPQDVLRTTQGHVDEAHERRTQ